MWWIAAIVVLDGLAGLSGAVIPEAWLERHGAAILGFAAGALVASCLGDVMPEAIARGGIGALGWSAGAIAVLVGARVLVPAGARVSGPAMLLASDALHNIADGVAIAAAFLVSTHVGLVTSIAIIAHELPEEIAAFALVRASGMRRRTALVALASIQLTAGVGAALGLFASAFAARGTGAILGIAGGTFLVLVALELLPALARKRGWAAYVACAAGAALVLAVPR